MNLNKNLFISTFKKGIVDSEIDEWLNNEVLEMDSDPALKYCFSAAEMTLLNPNGEVKIGDKILKLTEKGFVEIANMDVATLIRIDNGDITAYSEPTVTTNIEFEGESKDDCHWWKGKDYEHEYVNNKKKVKMNVHFHAYPWKGTSQAELTSYQKKNGKWKKYRMNLGVADQTYFKDNDCVDAMQGWSGWKRKKAKSISKNVANWGAFPAYRAEKGQSVYGHFEYAGKSSTKVLTW